MSLPAQKKLIFDRILMPKFVKNVETLSLLDANLREIVSAPLRAPTMLDRIRVALLEEDIQLGLRPAPEAMSEEFAV